MTLYDTANQAANSNQVNPVTKSIDEPMYDSPRNFTWVLQVKLGHPDRHFFSSHVFASGCKPYNVFARW